MKIKPFRTRAIAGSALAALVASPAHAAPGDGDNVRLTAQRTDQAPQIDGVLAPSEWTGAAQSDAFRQFAPVVGAAPGEATRVYVTYDPERLYVAVESAQARPIRATVMERDGAIGNDDHVALILDPLASGRNGYRFALNPLGAREDGLVENNRTFRKEWDALWSGASSVTPEGWVAEFAIPFRQLALAGDGAPWGLQVIRQVQSGNETIRLAAIDVTLEENDISNTARLDGIANVEEGMGADVQLYAVAAHQDIEGEGSGSDFQLSGNLSYRITPALTSTLTLNTDFSDAPLDPRQVNTGRFDLFTPETRDFFLKDAAAFEFGGRPIAGDPNGQPFFSRRIGLGEDRPIGIDVGLKLSGAVGRTSVGALVVQTEDVEGIDAQTLGVVRIAQPVFRESQIGAIITTGDPLGRNDTTVAGADFQYRNARAFDDGYLAIDAYALFSDGEEGTGRHLGGQIHMERATRYAFFKYKEIEDSFDAPLGFVNRRDIRWYFTEYGWIQRPANSATQVRYTGVWAKPVTDGDGTLQSDEIGVYTFNEFRTQDAIHADIISFFERVPADFELPGGVIVPAGDYRFTVSTVNLTASPARNISGNLKVICCEFYDGGQLSWEGSLTVTPSHQFAASLAFTHRDFSLAGGDVEVKILSLEGRYNVSPDINFAAELQHDNISQELGALVSARWEPQPGRELLVTLGHRAETDDQLFPRRWDGRGTTFTLRLGQLLQF